MIIAGDLGVWDETEQGARAKMLLKDFHDWVTSHYKKVFYVLGNPEPKTCDDAYFNQYDSWIEQQTNLVAWVHGHNHGLSDYMIGQTHVMCNPRGYIDLQPIADRFELEQLTVAL